MRDPAFIAWLGRMAKRASVGIAYAKPRPAETPAQAKKAVPRRGNPPTGGVLQQITPQGQPERLPREEPIV